MLAKLRSKKGFTLVELLIVIVILGILAAIVIARFAGATKESKESNLKGNLRTIRASLETYKANSKSNSYPPTLNDLWNGTNSDVDSKTFLERIPIDPFYRSKSVFLATTDFSPIDTALQRDAKISGTGGGWAYDSITGRVCANYYSTDTTCGHPLDTSWGSEYNIW
jgi:prepilin-type N-terminal cleavage/methylation domain-containing protein